MPVGRGAFQVLEWRGQQVYGGSEVAGIARGRRGHFAIGPLRVRRSHRKRGDFDGHEHARRARDIGVPGGDGAGLRLLASAAEKIFSWDRHGSMSPAEA